MRPLVVAQLIAFTAVLLPCAAPTPCWAAAKTCLTGTDPAVAGDLAQIAVVRTSIDSTCPCSSFDGSKGKAHGDYVKCAKGAIASSVATSQLRKQCKATVSAYYSNSSCGIPASQGKQPCVKRVSASGKVSCAIKPSARCVDSGKYTQAACAAFTLCIDAADTDGNGIIDTNDSGMCTVVPPPRFVDNGDGTITDLETGLMWEKKDQAGGLHAYKATYVWAAECPTPSSNTLCQPTMAAASACSAATGGAFGCALCSSLGPTCTTYGFQTIWEWLVELNSANFAGHSDWHIPTVGQDGGAREFETILVDGCQTSPCVTAAFNTELYRGVYGGNV